MGILVWYSCVFFLNALVIIDRFRWILDSRTSADCIGYLDLDRPHEVLSPDTFNSLANKLTLQFQGSPGEGYFLERTPFRHDPNWQTSVQ